MTTRVQTWAKLLGALSIGASGLLACDKGERQATEVPAATGEAQPRGAAECLHTDGCCGGHKEGDESCGGERAAADPEDGDGASAAATEPRRFSWTIEPGKAVEINVELAAGARMVARFEAEGSVAWNVHSHPGGAPKIHAEGTDAAGAPAFTASEVGVYSYLWVNKTQRAVKLAVELRIGGAGRVHSTGP